MRKLLFALCTLLMAYNSYATCTAGFTTAMAPLNNALLRLAMTNTCTGSTPTGSYTTYRAYWGDGSIVNIGAGTSYHTYSAPGTYHVTIMMTTTDSLTSTLICEDSIGNSVTVAYDPCGTYMTVTVSPTNALQVSTTASNPAGTSGVSYLWNWGDGSPYSSGATASHTYTSAGVKTVTLIDSTTGCSYVNHMNVSLTTSSCAGLAASFSHPVSGNTVSFYNTSTAAYGTTTSSSWNFGDGHTGTGNTTTHTYASTGAYAVTLVTTWRDSITSNFICADTAIDSVVITTITNTVYGYILQDSTTTMVSNPQYNVWLIQYDSTTNILSKIDSIMVTGNPGGYMTPYTFTGMGTGAYLVKAQMLNGPTSGTGAVPTYGLSSLLWSGATTVYHTSGTPTYQLIMMQYGTVTSGPGFVAGNVSAGANKGTNAGIPGMTVLLLNSANKPVTYATTDANGDYTFNNIADGNYIVYPENAGYATTSVSLNITNGNTTIKDVNFLQSQSHKTITPGTLSISNANAPVAFSMYPNPAKDKVSINWSTATKSDVSIVITDITGRKVYETKMTTTGNAQVNVNSLQKGMYLITLESNTMKTTQKLLVQ